jgi:hypothetical protein
MRRQRNSSGGGAMGLLLLAGAGGALWYYLSNYSTQSVTGTTANPVTVAGVGPIPVSPVTTPTLPQGPPSAAMAQVTTGGAPEAD